MRTMLGLAMGAALLGGCGHKKPMLTQQAFNDAARACGAQGTSGSPPPPSQDGAPDLHVTDSVVTVNGERIDASRCVAARLQGYSYGHLVLDAPKSATTP